MRGPKLNNTDSVISFSDVKKKENKSLYIIYTK